MVVSSKKRRNAASAKMSASAYWERQIEKGWGAGADGRMGQEACKAIENANDLILAAKADKKDNLALLIQRHEIDIVVDLDEYRGVFAIVHLLSLYIS